MSIQRLVDPGPMRGFVACRPVGAALAPRGPVVGAIVVAALMALVSGGCASLSPKRLTQHWWVTDYDTAERRSRERAAALVIYFSEDRIGTRDPLQEVLKDNALRRQLREYVCCRLYKSYEPDRRYVAQFGVDRAPAWIVVHADGTYHQFQGPRGSQEVSEFLSASTPPGRQPALNPLIPYEARYAWLEDLELAERMSEERGTPLLLVYYRRLAGDWAALERILKPREVFSRAGDMVHCRLSTPLPWTERFITGFGVLRLPALVVVRRDGGFEVLEKPLSAEAVARFLEAARRPPDPADVATAASAAAVP